MMYHISLLVFKQMKIGFVSRVSKTNAYEHTILGTQFYKPNEFARQITMDPKNMWGIVKEIVDLIRKQVNNTVCC
jgi:translation initiation factor 3 subunit D